MNINIYTNVFSQFLEKSLQVGKNDKKGAICMSRPNFKTYTDDYDKDGNIYIGKNYRHWKRLFQMFRKEYPHLWNYGTQWKPDGRDSIRINNPRKGEFVYKLVTFGHGQIIWKHRWKTDDDIRKEEREIRPDMYQNFLREIDRYQIETGASQGKISTITGISRQSINKYLSGAIPPKVSTMRKIAETLGLNI